MISGEWKPELYVLYIIILLISIPLPHLCDWLLIFSCIHLFFQGIKFKKVGPPSAEDIINAAATDAVR